MSDAASFQQEGLDMTESLPKELEDIRVSLWRTEKSIVIMIEHLEADTEMKYRAVFQSLIHPCSIYSSLLCLLASVVE